MADIIPEYLTTAQAAQYVNIAAKSLEAMRSKKQGPRVTRIGRRVRYSREDLDAFMRAHRERAGEAT